MGQLPVVKQTDVRRALEKAGFVAVHQSGSQVKLVRDAHVVIVQQHKGKDMPLGTLRVILAQAGMSVDEFKAWLKDWKATEMARYAVVLTPDQESGGYTVSVPSLPGCLTHGETVDESLAMARDAIATYLELPEGAAAIAEDRIEAIMGTVDVAVPA